MADFVNRIITILETRLSGAGQANKAARSTDKVATSVGGASQQMERFTLTSFGTIKGMKFLGTDMKALRVASDKFGLSQNNLRRGIKSGELELINYSKATGPTKQNVRLLRKDGKGYTEVLSKQRLTLGLLSRKHKEFNFRLLGGLFLGQALSATFLGLFRGTKQLAGIFDAISNIIGAALLPAFLPLALFLLDLAVRFLDTSEGFRKFIGIAAIGLGVLGFLVATFAAIGLGAEGFLVTLLLTAEVAKGAIGVFKGLATILGAGLGATFAFVGGLALGLFLGIKNLLSTATRLKGIAQIFIVIAGVIAAVLGAPIAIVGLLVAAIVLLEEKFGFLSKGIKAIGGFFKNTFGIGGGVPVGAEGGIVRRPTLAVIGDRGPEAVIPLNQTPGSSPLGGGVGGGVNIGITINTGLGADQILSMVNRQLSEKLRGAGIR